MPTVGTLRSRLALAALLAGCSTSAAPVGGCPRFVSEANLSSPSVSFANDVMPIFQATCGIGGESCHGDPSVTQDFRPLPFLGYYDSDGGATAFPTVRDGLVGVLSSENILMNLVTAGDPTKSFLMHKMDGDQCTLIPQCMTGNSPRPNCGSSMPYQTDLLDVGSRDTIRRWIQQGALDN